MGTSFSGFQYQPSEGKTWTKLETVQGKLMRALGVSLNTGGDHKVLRMRAASRTDAGVHAHGQVVEFYSSREVLAGTAEATRMLHSLNSLLPKTVRCAWVSGVPDSFHVIQDVSLKQYNYYLSFHSRCEDPFERDTRHQISRTKFGLARSREALERMSEAAKLMEGTHDFYAFSNKANDGTERDPVRTVERCECRLDSRGIVVVCRGKGFLYRQVRHMVGAMLWHARGKISLQDLEDALRDGESFVREGRRRWQPAPANGLHLMWISYEPLENGLVIPRPHELV